MREEEVEQIRDFNRFYTSIIGLLDNHILNTPYSLPDARILFELSHQQPCTASQIMESVKMDKGYMSRILRSFEKQGLLKKEQSKDDGRAFQLTLTAKGKKEFGKLNEASTNQVKDILSRISTDETKQVIHHMKELKRILNKNL